MDIGPVSCLPPASQQWLALGVEHPLAPHPRSRSGFSEAFFFCEKNFALAKPCRVGMNE